MSISILVYSIWDNSDSSNLCLRISFLFSGDPEIRQLEKIRKNFLPGENGKKILIQDNLFSWNEFIITCTTFLTFLKSWNSSILFWEQKYLFCEK